jgi:hypothetical protein
MFDPRENWKPSDDRGYRETTPIKSVYDSEEYNFKKLPLIKEFPESKEDVFDAFMSKSYIGHIMGGFKHCVENKIPFLLWNGNVYNWHSIKIEVNYFSLPAKKTKDFEDKLSKNIIFVKCFEPYDFSRNMGQLAVEITYTDGDTDILTTKSTKDNVFSSFEFDSDKEYFEFIKFLQENKIPKKQ